MNESTKTAQQVASELWQQYFDDRHDAKTVDEANAAYEVYRDRLDASAISYSSVCQFGNGSLRAVE